MEVLRAFLKSLDIDLPKDGRAEARAIQPDATLRLAETEHGQLINEMVLMKPGAGRECAREYRPFWPQPAPLRAFTSPIRRYSDLVSTALIRALDLGDDAGPRLDWSACARSDRRTPARSGEPCSQSVILMRPAGGRTPEGAYRRSSTVAFRRHDGRTVRETQEDPARTVSCRPRPSARISTPTTRPPRP